MSYKVEICCEKLRGGEVKFPPQCVVCAKEVDKNVLLRVRSRLQDTDTENRKIFIPYCKAHYVEVVALCKEIDDHRDVFIIVMTIILSLLALPLVIRFYPYLLVENFVTSWMVVNAAVLNIPILAFLLSIVTAKFMYRPLLVRRYSRGIAGTVYAPGVTIISGRKTVMTNRINGKRKVLLEFANDEIGLEFELLNGVT